MSDIKVFFEVFSWGVDYGQLLMEKERDSEDLFDAFNCYRVARKTAMPSNPTPRRMPHSEKWRNAKRESYIKFLDFLAEQASKKESTHDSD
ncbi:hypothetical protein AAIR98_000862 [Elusimicrobium simillimum]|uniref:hypothetical protein n=1 Tax=Elusimicrobium simillimum TaxID=3143438 RepID=UPI003C6F05E3